MLEYMVKKIKYSQIIYSSITGVKLIILQYMQRHCNYIIPYETTGSQF